MIRLVLNRLLWSVVLLVVVSAIVFVLVSLTPGSVAAEILGPTAATPENVAALNAKLGLDQPFYIQYVTWLGHAVQGDLGSSLFTGEPVSSMLNGRIGPPCP